MSIMDRQWSRHIKYGLPFMIAIVGGSFGLRYYTQLRYDIHNNRHTMTKIADLQKLMPGKPHTIEAEYEEYMKTVDLDNWQNKRGPRPWEDDNQAYKELIEKRAEESRNRWVFSSQ